METVAKKPLFFNIVCTSHKKIEGKKEKGVAEGEMVRYSTDSLRHKFEQTLEIVRDAEHNYFSQLLQEFGLSFND